MATRKKAAPKKTGNGHTSAAIQIAPGVEVVTAPLSDFIEDPHNLNDHTARGHSLLSREIRDNGIGRSMFATADGVMAAGNLTKEVVHEVMGDPRAIIVRTHGDVPIIHQRMDLASTDERAQQMALADNWIARVSLNLSPEAIGQADPDLLNRYMFAEEVAEITREVVIERDALEGFADHAQFSDEEYRAVIALPEKLYNDHKFKRDLQAFCVAHHVTYRLGH